MISGKFSKSERLLTKEQFARVFEAPDKKSTDRYFTILGRFYIDSSEDLKTAKLRLGLAIAKKHIKKAVNRNLIKRLVRESFRKLPSPQNQENFLDFVVMAKTAADSAEKSELHQSLSAHWRRLLK